MPDACYLELNFTGNPEDGETQCQLNHPDAHLACLSEFCGIQRLLVSIVTPQSIFATVHDRIPRAFHEEGALRIGLSRGI